MAPIWHRDRLNLSALPPSEKSLFYKCGSARGGLFILVVVDWGLLPRRRKVLHNGPFARGAPSSSNGGVV